MIVSMHITHSSAGGTEGLNNVVTLLEQAVPDYISEMELISEYVVVRTCNRFEVYMVTQDNRSVITYMENLIRSLVPSSNISYILEDMEHTSHS